MDHMGVVIGMLCAGSWGYLLVAVEAITSGDVSSWLWVVPPTVLATASTTAVVLLAALQPTLGVFDAGRQRGQWEILRLFWRD